MIKKIRTRSFVYLVIFIVLIFSLAGHSIAAPTSAYSEDWVDHFSSTALDGRWTWIRENSLKWSLTDNPGFLRLITSGSLHGVGGNLENLLTTPAPSVDFRVTTKVTFSPTENYLRAGVMIYGDDDNFIYLTRVFSDGQKVRATDEVNGSRQSWEVDISSDTVYLRIQQEGTLYICWYSLDGNSWTELAQTNRNLLNPKIGLGASQGPSLLEIPADFDFVEVESLGFTSIWEDPFNSATLNSRWSWVREDPALWSLTSHPGYMAINPEGSLHQDLSNDAKNILLTTPFSQDFQITSAVSTTVTENYHTAALIVYQDDDNYIYISKNYSDGEKIRWRKEIDAVASGWMVDEPEDEIYLRILKDENDYYGFYSLDDLNWTLVGVFTHTMPSPRVGLFGQLGPSLTQITNKYDEFKLEESPQMVYLPLVVR